MTAEPAVWRFEAIGAPWEVVTEVAVRVAARARIEARIDAFDRSWSRFRSDSTVTALAVGGAAPLPPDGAAMLDAYVALSAATDGAVNPLVGAALAHRGYDADYGFRDRGALATAADWQDSVAWDDGMLRLRRAGVLDVGALGKGRLVDVVAAEIDGPCVVDGSGDILVRGTTERIALEHPYDPRRAIGTITVTDAALCASATNRRTWGDGLHHVLDARTGEPVRAIAATWAVGGTAMRADAIATALFFDGGPELAADWGVEWVRMTTDGRVEWSPESTAEVFG